MRYRRDLDGLRAIAVAPVVLYHGNIPGFEAGFVGVDIFFVISGYLIAGQIIDGLQSGTFHFGAFYARRARRILPALLLIVVVTLAAATLVAPPFRLNEIGASVLATIGLSANIWFWATTNYASTAAELQPLIHAWSLGVEEQFYLFFPPLMALLLRWRYWRLLLLAIAIASLLAANVVDPEAAFYLAPFRAWELLAGALLAGEKVEAIRRRVPVVVATLLALLGLIILALGYALPVAGSASLNVLAAVAGASLIVAFADRSPIALNLIGNRAFVGVGLISYSLYLWHQPILALARIALRQALDIGLTAALIATSCIAAYASWRWIELTARDRHRTRLPLFIGVTGASITALACSAVFILASEASQRAPRAFDFIAWRDATYAERSDLLRMGARHFRADLSPPLHTFIEDWRCTGEGVGAGILIVGDSHAADKVMALRLSGVEPAQMTGAGCSVIPSRMTNACRDLFNTVVSVPERFHAVHTLVLAQRLGASSPSPAQIVETREFWGKIGRRIVWLSPMPRFPFIEDRALSNIRYFGSPFARPFELDRTGADEATFALELTQAPGFEVVDTTALLCGLTDSQTCQPFDAEGFLMANEDHLSAHGARRIGPSLLRALSLGANERTLTPASRNLDE